MVDSDDRRAQTEQFYISTATESAQRAAILPTKGSEDKFALLGKIEARAEVQHVLDEYLPNPAVEWVVHAKVQQPLDSKSVKAKFGREWREEYGALTLFGRDVATGRWTYLISSDGPKKVDGLQFAWNYHESWSEDAVIDPPELYDARIEAIKTAMASLTPATVHSDVASQDAYARAKRLSQINEQFDRHVIVSLVAPRGKRFAGREVWDVMLCLGLRWGDMDCFHWDNETGVGGDYHFDVWTSTAPGYFLPEEVAAGLVEVEDLVFSYSIPRSAAPADVFQRMMRAVKYAQERLGGTIQGEDEQPLDEDAVAEEIESIAEQLTQLGFAPGSNNALRQF